MRFFPFFGIFIILIGCSKQVIKKDEDINLDLTSRPTITHSESAPVALNYKSIVKTIQYPPVARLWGIEGKVILQILIDSTGNVKKVRVAYTDNSILNNAAINFAKKLKFIPAKIDRKPVTVWATIPVRFKLKNKIRLP